MYDLGPYAKVLVDNVDDVIRSHRHHERVCSALELAGRYDGEILTDRHEEIGVDALTLRRDLRWLEEKGLVRVSIQGAKAGLNHLLASPTAAGRIFLEEPDYELGVGPTHSPLENPRRWLPGLDPKDEFGEHCDVCQYAARFAAVYFRYGSNYTEEEDPKLAGLSSLFEDSPMVLGCSFDHLVRAIEKKKTESNMVEETPPDIIVNNRGQILTQLQLDVCKEAYGIIIPFGWDTIKDCSYGKETIHEFWAHEKWRWMG